MALSTLKTLPLRQLQCGLAEVIKYGVILDTDFFSFLERQGKALLNIDAGVYQSMVSRCCHLKVDTVVRDEKDITGIRAALNYGHTFGHALEKVTHYTALTHGEAIAIGMSMAVDLACRVAVNPELEMVRQRQEALFQAVGLPTRIAGCHPREILAAMRTDKKAVQGKIRLILPARMGQVTVVATISDELILAAIEGRCDRS
jgi:3-dehydroquinate synthase